MTDIKETFGTMYYPKAALVVYETDKGIHKGQCYVEYFDMDEQGCPINAHPLTSKEAQHLTNALNTAGESSQAFLKPKSIMKANILYIDPSPNGFAMWHTPSMNKQLFFVDNLGIPNGNAAVPALLWVADKHKLHIYALKTGRKPTPDTPLYHAPFFNVYKDGNVCMGTVAVNIKNSASLEEFTAAWEDYFFNSYFSHLMHSHNPVQGNCVSLWGKLSGTGEPFPKEALKKMNRTVKSLLK